MWAEGRIMTPREIINKALWLHSPKSVEGGVVLALVDLCEKLLAANSRGASDEDGVRREIDDALTVPLLAWADMLTERGDDDVADAMRSLARAGQWPGRLGGKYRWAEPRFGGASWTLPKAAYAILMKKHYAKKGRFDTASEAMLAAAEAMAEAKRMGEEPIPEGHARCMTCGIVPTESREVTFGFTISCSKCGKPLYLDWGEAMEGPF